MKKVSILLFAAALALSAATGAEAIDFKAKGQWVMSFDYGQGSRFANFNRVESERSHVAGWGGRGSTSSADNFSAQQRVRLQLDAVASETLSGTVFFEIGEQNWGQASNGAALGTDGTVVEIKNAYLDWIVPSSDVKVRMGMQNISLPAFTTGGSQILSDDVAGITVSTRFNDNVSLTALWARPYNDNYVANKPSKNNFMDNMDLFSLLLPLSFDGVKLTPWAMIGYMGPNTFRGATMTEPDDFFESFGPNGVSVVTGMYPAVVGLKVLDATGGTLKGYSANQMVPVWLGFTGEVTAWDPLRLAWDVNYGNNGASYEQLRRQGWYASALAEYKLDWGTPGIYGWYSSGDDGNYKNGSERMPTLRANGNNEFSHLGGNGNPYIAREGLIGMDLMGTWGVGARVKDLSFVENLKHTLRINYFQGTNSPTMARFITDKVEPSDYEIALLYSDFNRIVLGGNNQDLYLTTGDHALELGLSTSYKMYDNLTVYADAGYIALWLDQSHKVWGSSAAGAMGGDDPVRGLGATGAWNINVSFVYEF